MYTPIKWGRHRRQSHKDLWKFVNIQDTRRGKPYKVKREYHNETQRKGSNVVVCN